MSIKIAINGFGRIGRNIVRALYESKRQDITVVAINDLGDIATSAHLLKYDTTHGTFLHNVSSTTDKILINTDEIFYFSERDPKNLPWGKLDVDIVLECTGVFNSKSKSRSHIDAGAKKVVISAPCGDDIDATIVYGINHQVLTKEHKIISNASCTTNCLAPLALPLHKELCIDSGLMTTIHAVTNDQVLSDVAHKDLRRARAAMSSMIPTKTGAAAAVGLVLPELNGKLDGFAMRVPTINVSVTDLTFTSKRDTSVEEVNSILEKAANTYLKDIVEINTLPLVSCDFNHNTSSSIFDLTQTKVIGKTVKVLSWYDNEWGFSNRMLDTAVYFAGL